MRAFVSDRVARLPSMGRRSPRIDINAASGEIAGIQVVVSSLEQPAPEREYSPPSTVKLGAAIDRDHVVTDVTDELQAAGLRTGDRVLGATQSGVELDNWHLRYLADVRWGEEVTVRIRRSDQDLLVTARAPLFGSQP